MLILPKFSIISIYLANSIFHFRISTYCFEHSRQSQINKTKTVIGNFKNIDATETLVASLSHHVKVDKVKPQSTISPFDEDDEIDVVTPAADPFMEINAAEINNRGKIILDYASDSSSEEEPAITLSNTWRNHELDNSDDESVDSADDVLNHAGIYTMDEIATITKEKMQRLQALYIDQFERLKYVLREKRRQYLLAIKREKEIYSSIHDQYKDSPRERKLYSKLKALNHYHNRFGVEALLHRQYLEKRQKASEPTIMAAPAIPQPKNIPKCNYTEGGVKCLEKSVLGCKFCRKHIMEDKKQVLFKACGIEKSGIVCQEPVVNIFEDSTCILHMPFPVPKQYVKRKYESEDDDAASIEIKKEKIEIKDEIQDVEMDTTTVVGESSDATIKIEESTTQSITNNEVVVD